MGKKSQQTNNQKTKLIFKGNPHVHFKKQTIIDFKIPKNNPQYHKALDRPIYPVFNNDCRYYTPGFILAKIDKLIEEDLLTSHNQKIDSYLQQIEQDQIVVPKPSSKTKYCGVCKTTFEDYLEHIQSNQHINILSEANYQKEIIKLCIFFKDCLNKSNDSQIQSKISIQTKINEQESFTEYFIDEKREVV